MARDYYDWRGIAMLTQQLGQLFEPSKSRLMSDQQEHEMNMMMAKKTWDVQTAQLEILNDQYDTVRKEFETAKERVEILGGEDLVKAGMGDGSRSDDAFEMFDKIELKDLDELHELSKERLAMIDEKNTFLNNFKLYDRAALMGEEFSKKMVSSPAVGEPKEYDVLADTDGITGLSWKEKQKALNMFVKDADYVLAEDDKGGIVQNIWDGANYERLNVKPEAVAFISGYNATLNKEKLAETKRKGAEPAGRPSLPSMPDPQVITIYNQNNDRINQINNKGKEPLEKHLAFDQFGEYFAEKGAVDAGYTPTEIDEFLVAVNVRKDALREIKLRTNIDIPADKLNIKHPMSNTINKTDNPSTFNLFDNAKISPDILYAKIMMKQDDDDYISILTAYNDIMDGDRNSTEEDRQKGFNIILNWINE